MESGAGGWPDPPNAASRCWKPHFRRLSDDLLSEIAISESSGREIRQDGEQSVGCCKTKGLWLNPFRWRLRAEEGVTAAGKSACRGFEKTVVFQDSEETV
jgi:hypothetical protein